MPLQPVLQSVFGMIAQMEALAAVGARLGSAATPIDPDVDVALDGVMSVLGRDAISDLTGQERQIVVSFITSFFRQAVDLIENPARPAGWSFSDPVILQNIGQGSKVVVEAIAGLAATEPDLARRLQDPSRFLDVGTGVGWIAIEMARRWPALIAEGIDIFPTALALAADNLAKSNLGDGVSFRHDDILTLETENRYASAFLAAPFIPKDVIPVALRRLHTAMEPGGWLFFGLMDADPAPLPQALLKLRIARFGGYPWSDAEVRDLLRAAGFTDKPDPVVLRPARLVVGRRL